MTKLTAIYQAIPPAEILPAPNNVLITRPLPQGLALCKLVTAAGYSVCHFPTLDFAPLYTPHELNIEFSHLVDYDWLCFISPQAVYASLGAMQELWPDFCGKPRLVAIGGGTARVLQQAGFDPAFYSATAWSSQGLLATPAFNLSAGQQLAIITGADGDDTLVRACRARQAQVKLLAIYKRILPNLDAACYARFVRILHDQDCGASICLAGAAVRNLLYLLESYPAAANYLPILLRVPLIVPSQRIKSLALTLGFQTILVSENPSASAILDILHRIMHAGKYE